MKELIFVGQGPNRQSWEWCMGRGMAMRPSDPEWYAKKLSARLALTGAVGRKLAELLGISFHEFVYRRERFNLNGRYNGRKNGADAFDAKEGTTAAALLMADHPGARFVCLGRQVSDVFFDGMAPLCRAHQDDHSFFHLPHPSGLNRWWNDADNKKTAEQELRMFCAGFP